MTRLVTPESYHPQVHLKPLDGLRGMAILMVLFTHAFESNYANKGLIIRAIGTFFNYGIFGVDLFFVLSGFLITGILFDSLSDPGYFRKFYARRTLRIFPLYYAVLGIAFLLTHPLHLQWHGMGWLLFFYLQNLRPVEIAVFSPGGGIGMNHFWSLAVEEQFYLFWPAIVFWAKGWRRLMWTTLGISTFALMLRIFMILNHFPERAIHVSTITRADSLLLGGTLALLYRSPFWSKVQQLAPYLFSALVLILTASIYYLPETPPDSAVLLQFWLSGLRYPVLAVASACLIAWSLRPGSLCQWFFKKNWLRFLGKYSYGIYVLHMLFLPMLLGRLRPAIEDATHSKLLAVVGASCISFVISIVLGYLSFHLFEKHFLSLKKYFAYERETATEGKDGTKNSLSRKNLVNS